MESRVWVLAYYRCRKRLDCEGGESKVCGEEKGKQLELVMRLHGASFKKRGDMISNHLE